MIKHEFWRVVASGLVTTLINDMASVTNKDARYRLYKNGAFWGKWIRDTYGALSYVVEDETARLVLNEVADPIYNPQLREQAIPMVGNAAVSGGDTLVGDVPPEGYTACVYSWDFTEFALLGPLAENSQPGPGFYILACTRDSDGSAGLPSTFLELTS